MYDSVIIGGSHAGLSTALVLARAGRQVLVVDSGNPRSFQSPLAHAYHTRDGEYSPLELLHIARSQLTKYPGVVIRDGTVSQAFRHSFGFSIEVGSEEISGRTLVLATGCHDRLPSIPAIKEIWGKKAFRCPYCDGFELKDQPLAVIGHDEQTLMHLQFLRIWSENLTLYTNGIEINGVEGIPVICSPIENIQMKGENFVEITASSEIFCYQGIFLWPTLAFQNNLAAGLGCGIKECGAVKVDAACKTSIDGVYAVGDLIEEEQHMIALAVSSGLKAAFAINQKLAQ